MFLFIFEGLGTSELILILVVALVLFGPRKLPQLSRSLGKSLANFKRASEDFKQTWEKEVALEEAGKEAEVTRAMLPEDNSILAPTVGRAKHTRDESDPEAAGEIATSATPASPAAEADEATSATVAPGSAPPPAEGIGPTRKRDWL